jgi:hypothetical protein
MMMLLLLLMMMMMTLNVLDNRFFYTFATCECD